MTGIIHTFTMLTTSVKLGLFSLPQNLLLGAVDPLRYATGQKLATWGTGQGLTPIREQDPGR